MFGPEEETPQGQSEKPESENKESQEKSEEKQRQEEKKGQEEKKQRKKEADRKAKEKSSEDKNKKQEENSTKADEHRQQEGERQQGRTFTEQEVQQLMASRQERLGILHIPEGHEMEWLRDQMAILEQTGTGIPQQNISIIIQSIQILNKPDLEKKLLAELYARYYLHEGALALSRVQMDGYIQAMGGQPVEFMETVSKVNQVAEAIDLFEGKDLDPNERMELNKNIRLGKNKLIDVFSAATLHQDDDVKDSQGNTLDEKITRQDKIKSGFYDLKYYKNLFKAELLIKLIKEDKEQRKNEFGQEIEADLSSIQDQLIEKIKEEFEKTDRFIDETGEKQIEDVFEFAFNLSDKQKAKLARLRTQAQTAVNLTEKLYRVTGIASTCDVPDFYSKDIPEIGAKAGAVKIPFAKGFRQKADGTGVEQVLLEKGKRVVNGKEELFDFAGDLVITRRVVSVSDGKTPAGTIEVEQNNEDEVAAEAVRLGRQIYQPVVSEDDERVMALATQVGNITPNSRGIQRGSGDYALWRCMWMSAYTERLQRGRAELRPYVVTGMLSFSLFKILPGMATSKENAQTQVLVRSARGQTVMDKARPEEAGLKRLLENVRTGNWNNADWGDWLGNLKQADVNREMLESREGYLYNPSTATIMGMAVKGYQNFKDKENDRQMAIAELIKGAIKYNTNRETVEKYHGKGAKTWSFRTDVRYILDWALRRGFLSKARVDNIRKDKEYKPQLHRVVKETWSELGAPVASGMGEDFAKAFFGQFFRLAQAH